MQPRKPRLNERELTQSLLSCCSGPKRYDYDVKHAAWFYHRDGTTLKELLDAELAEITGEPVNVPLSV